MTYDLTIRADRTYSQFADLDPVTKFIKKLPQVRPNGPSGFVLDDPPDRWMNISLEVADESGDSVAAEEDGKSRVNCIRLHIPYANLGDAAERDYFPVATAIARFLGWKVYDRQTGEDLPAIPGRDPRRGEFHRQVLGALGIDSTAKPKARKKRPPGKRKKGKA